MEDSHLVLEADWESQPRQRNREQTPWVCIPGSVFAASKLFQVIQLPGAIKDKH